MAKQSKELPELPEGAEPTQWGKLLFTQITSHRYMACPFYGLCLDYASILHWEGWSCKWCPLWQTTKKGKLWKELTELERALAKREKKGDKNASVHGGKDGEES